MPRFHAWRVLVLAAAVASGTATAADIASDPMRPDTLRSVAASAPAHYRVNAIIVSDERRIAIVNGQRVGVGDDIGNATVISISKAEVVVDIDGKRQSLRVNKGAGQ
ncbi:MAG: hypothetical protein R3288_14540 [Woeseiaceae bacterium]|nr:hypothetical protein [Woeseiaceae bacterium]